MVTEENIAKRDVYLVGEWEKHDYSRDPLLRSFGYYRRLAKEVYDPSAIARKQAPGLQQLPPNATVVKTVLRWGVTDYADLENVKVLRLVDGKPLQEIVNVKAVLEGDELASDMALEHEDIVIVPKIGETNRVYITGSVAQNERIVDLIVANLKIKD